MNKSIKHSFLSIKSYELFYLVSFVIWLSVSLLRRTMFLEYIPDDLFITIRLVCICFLLLTEAMHKGIKVKTLIAYFILLLCAILLINASFSSMVDTLFFVLAARNVSLRPVLKTAYAVFGTVLVIVVFSASIGFINNYIAMSDGGIKYYLGFRYSLYPSIMVFMIAALHLYLRGEKSKWFDYVYVIMLQVVCFAFTGGRLSFGLGIAMVVIIGLVSHFQIDVCTKRIGTVAALSFIICFIVSLVLVIAYNPGNDALLFLDMLLDGRLRLGSEAVHSYGIGLFSQDVLFVGNILTAQGILEQPAQYNYVDALFIQMLIKCGLLYTLFVLYVITKTAFIVKSKKDNIMLLIIAFLALRSLIDDLAMNLYFDPFIMVASLAVKFMMGSKKYTTKVMHE